MMKFNTETPWHRTWCARFGQMSDKQKEGIELAMHDSMRATPSELNRAVAMLAGSWNEDRRPNITDIGDKVSALRGDAAGITTPNRVTFYHNGTRMTETMGNLKMLLNRRPDPVEAWNIICTPINTDQCRELMSFCDAHRIKYQRFIPPNTDYAKELLLNMDERKRIDKRKRDQAAATKHAQADVYEAARGQRDNKSYRLANTAPHGRDERSAP